MRLPLKRSLLVAMLLWTAPVLANPVLVGPPPMVDGQPVAMPTVQKWGQYWYPASLVGHNRGIAFAFDHATNTLYADGSVLDLDTLVIDGVVYIPLQPEVTNTDLRPGMTMLEARRKQYEEMESGMPEKVGNTEMLFMENSVDMPEHPWAEGGRHTPTGPVINLEATGTAHVPAHIASQSPHVVPSGNLPNRIPRIAPTVPEEPTPQAPTYEQGIPLRISTQGGPQAANAGAAVTPVPSTNLPAPNLPAPVLTTLSSPTGLQPIPKTVAAAVTAPSVSSGGALAASRAKNQAFEVSVLSGGLQNSSSDRLLSLKINQKNLSPVAQANLGTFALRCQDGSRLEPVKSRTVMPDGTLAPGGVREGELLFRLSPNSEPKALELEGTLPLSVPLAR